VVPLATDADQSTLRADSSLGMPLDADGSFEVAVNGRRRFAVLAPLDGWYLKAARVHGVDALDNSFDVGADGRDVDDVELVVSPSPATVSGKVLGSAGEVRTDCAVVLFSTDPSKWYRQSQALRLERPSQSGEFHIGSLPPGSYSLLAVSDLSDLVTTGDWQDPATLDKLRSASTEVTVNESESRSVTLRVKIER
jgi:hypothetical protein